MECLEESCKPKFAENSEGGEIVESEEVFLAKWLQRIKITGYFVVFLLGVACGYFMIIK